jgi:hypothetical protein
VFTAICRFENALTIRVSETDFDLVALDEALNRLAAKEAQLAKDRRTEIF